MLTLDELITAARQARTHVVEGGKDFTERKLEKMSEMAAKMATPMERPLPRPKQERLKQKASYKTISNDVSGWLPAISANRRSDTLTLFIDQETSPSISSVSVENMEPETPLEQEMQAILDCEGPSDRSKMNFDETIQDQDDGYEAARKRQIELQKLRSFLFFQQQRNSRIAKIKSKAFRKVHKTDNKKQLDPLREEIERARARIEQGAKRQRILSTLSHQKKMDEEKRVNALKELIYSEDENEDAIEEQPKSAIFSLSFMKRNKRPQDTSDIDSEQEDIEEMNDEDDKSDTEEVFGKRTFSKQSKTTPEIPESNQELLTNFTKEDETFKRQKTLIEEAFKFERQEEVDFLKEKQETIEEELPKPLIDATLPGWGSWAGHGIAPSTKRRFVPNPDKEARIGVKIEQRKDASLSHVIIREKCSSRPFAKKYQIEKIPYPYENEGQFNAANYLMPVGRDWNPVSIVERKVRPRITQQINGNVINPLPLHRKA